MGVQIQGDPDNYPKSSQKEGPLELLLAVFLVLVAAGLWLHNWGLI